MGVKAQRDKSILHGTGPTDFAAYLDSFVGLLLVGLLVVCHDDAVLVVVEQNCVHLWPGNKTDSKKGTQRCGGLANQWYYTTSIRRRIALAGGQ